MPKNSTSKPNDEASSFDQSVGEVVNFIGLKGLLRVAPSSNNPSLFLDIEDVLLQCKKISTETNVSDGTQTLAKIRSLKIVKNCFEIGLEGYDSRTEVEHFRGATMLTKKEQLRTLSSDQWWVSDLIGLTVYAPDGSLIGTVCDAPGQHGEFLEIKKADDANGKTAIISFAKELFPVVDIVKRRIEMIDLPGLFE